MTLDQSSRGILQSGIPHKMPWQNFSWTEFWIVWALRFVKMQCSHFQAVSRLSPTSLITAQNGMVLLKIQLVKEAKISVWSGLKWVQICNSTVFAPQGHFVNEISNQLTACLSEKLYCNWIIMLVTMATPISSHMKDKNSIFTARGEDNYDFLVKGEILVFHQYLYNKRWEYMQIETNFQSMILAVN